MKKWMLALLALVVVVGGGAALYGALSDDAPQRATVDDIGAAPTTGSVPQSGAGLDGDWTAGSPSSAGYRIRESFAGGLSGVEAVGTTSEVTGTLRLSGTAVTAVDMTVRTAGIRSDSARRDGQYRRLMAVDQHPTATFRLTSPIELGSVPADGAQITATASGELQLRGTSRPVTFDLRAKRVGAQINVDAAIPVVFSDYGIDSPSIPGIVSVEDRGQLELALAFVR